MAARPLKYLESAETRKEDVARDIARPMPCTRTRSALDPPLVITATEKRHRYFPGNDDPSSIVIGSPSSIAIALRYQEPDGMPRGT
jgi:hypothetical protein